VGPSQTASQTRGGAALRLIHQAGRLPLGWLRAAWRPCSSTYSDSVQQAGLRPLRLTARGLAAVLVYLLGLRPASWTPSAPVRRSAQWLRPGA